MTNGIQLNYGSFVVVDDRDLTPHLRTRIVNETYEEPEIAQVRKLITAGDRVLELGSGMGLVSLHIASICSSDNLCSIEANMRLIEVARRNGSSNGFSFNIRHGLASNETENTARSFYIDPNFLASSGSGRTAGRRRIAVPQIDVARQAIEFGATGIVADIEGDEQYVLRGSYLSGIDKIVVELHPTVIAAEACRDMLLYLSRQGFLIDLTRLQRTVIGLHRSRDDVPEREFQDSVISLVVDFLAASAMNARGQYSEASALLETLCRVRSDVLEFHLRLAESYLKNADGSSALSVLGRYSGDHDIGDEGNVLLAQALLREGRLEDAYFALSRLSAAYARRPQTMLLLARIALRMRRFDESQKLVSAAVEACPWSQEYRSFADHVRQKSGSRVISAAVSVKPSTVNRRSNGMGELVLHIGLPKTATSYLQRWLTVNAKPLRERGVWVPHRQIFSHRLAVETITRPDINARDDVAGIRRTSLEDVMMALRLAAKQTEAQRFVISSEYFYEADPEDVKQRLTAELGLPVKIIVLLRRQDRLVESGYNQSVKAMGETGPIGIPKYLTNLDWYEFVAKWGQSFGKDSIAVLNFDRLAPAGQVLSGFLAAIDPELASAAHDAEFSGVESLNESLPADLLEFKRIANELGETGMQEFLYRLIAAGHEGPAFRMKEESARKIIALYDPSNERLAREVLGSEEPLFPPYGGTEGKAGVDLYGQLSIETLAKVIAYSIRETSETTKRMAAELKELRATLVRMQQ